MTITIMSDHRSLRLLFALMIAGVMVSSCAGPDPFADWTDRDLARRVEVLSRATSGDMVETSGYLDMHPADDDLPIEVDLAWYTSAAIQRNPKILAARQRVERLRERIPQATALPDPMASVTFGELAQTAAGEVDYIVGIQQALPYPGTLDARGEVARQEVEVSLHALQAVIDRITGEVQRAYWSYDGAAREVEVLEQNRELLTQIESAVRARVRVGAAKQADLLRVSREVAAMENRISRLNQRQRTASAMLARLTSRRAPAEWPRIESSVWVPIDLDAPSLRRLTMTQNHHVAMAQAKAQTYRQRLVLARQERKPDFVLGLQYGAVSAGGLAQSANGDDQIAGTVGVTLPFWSGRYNASEREAMRGMGEALAEVRAAQDRAAFEVEEALARIDAHQQSLRRLQERMMPDVRQIIDVAFASYRTGDTGFIQLLDDWQVLLGDQLEEVRITTGLHRAMADLEQTVGGAVTTITTQSTSRNPESGGS